MGILSRLLGSAFSGDGDNKTGTAAVAVPASTLSPAAAAVPPSQLLTVAPASSSALEVDNAAPGQQQLQQQQQQPPPHRFFSQRSARQLSLFLGGAGFFYWSLLISKRAIARHRVAAQLKFYQPNGFGNTFGPQATSSTTANGATAAGASPAGPQRGPFVAVEALNLATLNTISFFVMAAGGVAWGLDISDLEDMRRIARRSIEGAGGGMGLDEQAEKEVAEWVAKTLGLNLEEGEGAKAGGAAAEGARRKSS